MNSNIGRMDLRASLDNKLVPLLATVLVDSNRHAAEFRFNKHHSQQLTVVCMYCTIIELAHGEQALIEKGQTTALPVLLRSMFEAYADLRALIDDPDYDKRMYATFLKEKIRFLKNVRRTPSNPFFNSVRAGMDVGTEITNLELEIAKFKSQGKKPLEIVDRFESATLEHEYQSIYWLLCLEGHNNMSALDDRHIKESGNEFEVVLFKEADVVDMVRIIDAILAVVIDGGIRVHSFLKTQAVQQFESHRRVFDEYRAEYSQLA